MKAIARSAPDLYRLRAYVDGDERRELMVPSDALKEIQRKVYEGILRPLPVNACVHSAPGRSIITNAQRHAGHSYLSTFDVRHCFPSIGPRRVRAALERAGFDGGVAKVLTRLTTVGHQLPQGAPTSPALLNAVLVDLDGKLAAVAHGAGLTYSRYVDDVFLSGGARTPKLARVVESVIARHRLQLHPKKRFDWGPHDVHLTTHLVVNTTPSASPEYVADLETIIGNHRRGKAYLTAADLDSVRGKVSFVMSVNEEQGARLERLLEAAESGAAAVAT